MDKPATTFQDRITVLMVQFLDQFREMAVKEFTFGQLLYLAEKRHCKEPIDRVWAIMGLLLEATKRQIQAAGIIDYSITGRQEYWRTYAAVMKQLFLVDPLDFWFTISRGEGFSKHSLLPSWCPDWSAPTLYNPLYLWNLHAGYRDPPQRLELVASVVAKSLHLLPNASSRLVAGRQVDTVQRVSTLPPFKICGIGHLEDMKKEMAAYQEYLRWIEECVEIADAVHHPVANHDLKKSFFFSRLRKRVRLFSEGDVDVLCQTLVAFDGRASRKYPKSWQKSYKALLNHWKTWHGEESWDTTAEELAHPLESACSGRRFFNTVNGRIGIGPPDIAAGDRVCLVIGGGPLFTLRPSDEQSSRGCPHGGAPKQNKAE